MKKILASVCIFCLVVIFQGGPDPAAGGQRPDRATEKKVIDLVNRARTRGVKCGSRYYRATRPVHWNEALSKASLAHSEDMAREERMGHNGGDGSKPGERIARSGYRWMTYGENVGEGYLSAEEVVDGWLRSRGHCENIMNPGFKEAGAAYARGAKRLYWTLVFASPELSSFIVP
ncbi:MAG: CAP domain-containing protein [Nitrospirae bacterium]|nr:CAP domain-containing protein [Nitrospirota bacterium]